MDISEVNIRVHDLIENFSAHNYDTVEFTCHVENAYVRLRLLNNQYNSLLDGTHMVETFANSIERILKRKRIPYTIIEHLNMDMFTTNFGKSKENT